mgnify:CR=1 FL=1
MLHCIIFQILLLRRDLSRVLSAKCNRFAYTYNRQGFLYKFSLLTLLMIATEPISVPEELRQVQAHPGGLDEAVSGETRCGHRPPPAEADAHPAPGQGYGVVRDFPFPSASGKMKSVLRTAPRWDKVSQSRGHDRPAQLLDTLSRGHFGTTCPESVGSVPTPEHAAGMGQETFSGRTATESKMEGTHER